MREILQHDEKDCGVACFATICAAYGLKIPLVKLREEFKISRNGVSVYSIVETMKKFKFLPEVLQGDIEELIKAISKKEIIFPFIAHIIVDNYLQHYVVVKKIRNGKIYIFDPAKGKMKYSVNKFSDLWTGYIINCKQDDKFERGNFYKGFFKTYKTILLEQKKLFIVIIFISAIAILCSLMSAFTYKIVIDNYILKNPLPQILNIVKMDWGENGLYLFGVLIVLYMFQLLINYSRSIILNVISKRIEKRLFFIFTESTLNLPISFFVEQDSGGMLSRFNSIMEIENILSRAILTIFLDSCYYSQRI